MSGQIYHGHDNRDRSVGAGVFKTLMPPLVIGVTPRSIFMYPGFTFPAPTGRVPNLNAGTTTYGLHGRRSLHPSALIPIVGLLIYLCKVLIWLEGVNSLFKNLQTN